MENNRIKFILIPAALFMGVTFFLAITLFLTVNFNNFSFSFDNSVKVPIMIPFIALFLGSQIITFFLPKFSENDSSLTDQEILKRITIKYALLEGAALFGIVMLLVTHIQTKAVNLTPAFNGLIAYLAFLLAFAQDFSSFIKLSKQQNSAN